MRIALAQINPTVGDIAGNSRLILQAIDAAKARGADLLITPELAVFGYPPKDLLLRRGLIERNVRALHEIAAHCTNIAAAVGYVQPDADGGVRGVFNAAAFCRGGRVEATYGKILLPTYDVFDEVRYFNTGRDVVIVEMKNGDRPVRLGLSICEDLWNDEQFEGRRMYGDDPIERTVQAGADAIINLSSSPYRAGINERREGLFVRQIREHRVPLFYVNQVGGNDELIFDGGSLVLDAEGRVVARAKAFTDDLLIVDWNADGGIGGRVESYPDKIDSIRGALVLGIRDYLRKCGFSEVVLGLSGGIDSALTATLAAEAIGSDHVYGVAMPSRYSSAHSMEDARQLAENLGLHFSRIPIDDVHRAFERALGEHFAGLARDVTEENVQSRIRGNLLMALSNKFNRLLLTTGNKSELAVGFCTLYGDMSGGLAVLSDVPKTIVYALARRINETAGRDLIPQHTIEKPPSAELRDNQTDLDTLPPYDVLDAILEHYVEYDRSVDEIVAMGFDGNTVSRVAHMVDTSEYKRKQIPVGIKVTSRAFGTGRRMPIAAKYQ
jgi:NAD+ synthase (glutamine-hydrolysing)